MNASFAGQPVRLLNWLLLLTSSPQSWHPKPPKNRLSEDNNMINNTLPTWTTADGVKHRIEDLETDHLHNIVKYSFTLNRVPTTEIHRELANRGELATVAWYLPEREGYKSPAQLTAEMELRHRNAPKTYTVTDNAENAELRKVLEEMKAALEKATEALKR